MNNALRIYSEPVGLPLISRQGNTAAAAISSRWIAPPKVLPTNSNSNQAARPAELAMRRRVELGTQ